MGGYNDPTSGPLFNRLVNPPNPIETLGTMAKSLDAAKQFQANQAVANAYQQSIDPNTGQLDIGKFNALTASGPGAYNMGATMQQAGQGVGAQGQGTSADVKAKLDQLGAIGQMMYPLLRDGAATQSIDPAAVQAQLDQANKTGLITPQQYAAWSGQLKGMNPKQAFGFVAGANMGNSEAYRQLGGTIVPTQTGPAVAFPQVSPMGAPSAVPSVSVALSPESIAKLRSWEAEPYDWTDANNVEHKGGTKGDFLRSRGINPETFFTNNTVPAPGSPPPVGPVSSVTTGRPLPAAPAAAPGPSGGATAAPAPAPAPPATTPQVSGPPTSLAPPPGPSTEAIPGGSAATAQKAYSDAQDLQKTLPERINPLINALSVLRANPDLQTAGLETVNDVKQKLAAYGVNVPNMTGANAYQELAKYLAQYTRGIPGANRSDLAALDAAAATPHMAQGPQVIQTLTAKLVGSERLRAAGVDQFNSQYPDAVTASKNSAQYQAKTSAWMSKQDPIAYGMDEMTPQEIGAYYNGLSKDAKTRFENSAKDAYRLYGTTPGSTVGRPATPPPAAAVTAPTPTTPPPPVAPTPSYMSPQQMYGGG